MKKQKIVSKNKNTNKNTKKYKLIYGLSLNSKKEFSYIESFLDGKQILGVK